MKNENKLKGEPRVYYSPSKYKKKDFYDIPTGIREHVTLFHLIYSLDNVNHAISVFWYWIFGSNYKGELIPNREPLDMIFTPYVGDEEVTKFETLFAAVICICLNARLKKDYL